MVVSIQKGVCNQEGLIIVRIQYLNFSISFFALTMHVCIVHIFDMLNSTILNITEDPNLTRILGLEKNRITLNSC